MSNIVTQSSVFIEGLDLKDSERPDVSVVIVNTNTRHLLIPCLKSLYENNKILREVML